MFDWNEANIAHVAEHDVTPAEAEQAVTNKPIYLQYVLRGGEDRFTFLGETLTGRVLFFVVTPRNALTRVVTAFTPERELRAFYVMERDAQYGDREEDSARF